MKSLKISVILPVYNGEKYLACAIYSILNQTYKNFELIIINDGSTDNSKAIITKAKAQDPRISHIENQKNLGLIASLNLGLEKASGDFIARMDQDDIALPNRLELQLDFLQKLNRPAIVGTNIIIIDDKNHISRIPRNMYQLDFENFWVKFRKCPVHHPTVMFSREIVSQFMPFYHLDDIHAEDYCAWLRINRNFPIYNLPDALLFYRIHDKNISTVFYVSQKQRIFAELKKNYLDVFGYNVNQKTIESLLFLRLSVDANLNQTLNDIYQGSTLFIQKFGHKKFVNDDLAYTILSIGLKANAITLFKSALFIIVHFGFLPIFKALMATAKEGTRNFLLRPYLYFRYRTILNNVSVR